MPPRLFKRFARVSCWRETIPKDPGNFIVDKVPGSTLEITDLRIQFSINKTLKKSPNTCDITITNLSQKTRADLEVKPLLVQLDTGYDEAARLTFVGDLRFAMTKMVGADWETLLQLGDADCHYRWAMARKSYGPGVTARQIIKDTVENMGLEFPTGLEKDGRLDEALTSGETTDMPARKYLTEILSPYGYTWSTQDGKMQILRERDVKNVAPILIDEEHGMIGSPEFGSPPRSGKPPHMTVKMLLYPQVNPGALVQLTSKVKSGLFKCEAVSHRGDTHGEVWESEFELKPHG